MDAIIKDVNEGWDEDGQRTHFKGSDDYLRQKVSETLAYDSARHSSSKNSSRSIYLGPLPLSSMPTSLQRVKEATWLSQKVSYSQTRFAFPDLFRHAGGEHNSIQDYNPLWISELRRTNAYEVWEHVTDPLLFDIAEPR